MNANSALGAGGRRFESGHPDQLRARVDLGLVHAGSQTGSHVLPFRAWPTRRGAGTASTRSTSSMHLTATTRAMLRRRKCVLRRSRGLTCHVELRSRWQRQFSAHFCWCCAKEKHPCPDPTLVLVRSAGSNVACLGLMYQQGGVPRSGR